MATGYGDTSTTLRRTGVGFLLTPGNLGLDIEVQEAPDSSGAPGTWATVAYVTPTVRNGGVTRWVRELPLDEVFRHYRFRHVGPDVNDGPWSGSFRLKPDRFVADQLDGVPGNPGVGFFGGQPVYLAARSAGHGVFLETFDGGLPATWFDYDAGAGVESLVTTGQAGGKAYKAQGYRWRAFPGNIPYDPSKLYRIRCRVRRTATSDNTKQFFYCGVIGVGADGVTLENVSGTDTHGSQHYVCASNVNASAWTVDAWQEFTGWFKGWAATGGSTPSTDPLAPKALHQDVRYFRPVFIVNYTGGPVGNVMELDYIAVDVFDEEGQRRLYEAITASGDLDQDVTQSDGANQRVLARGRETGQGRNGDSVAFGVSYQNPPLVVLAGGISYEPRSGQWSPSYDSTKPQYQDRKALNLTASGFTLRAQLRQKGATTAQKDDFPSLNALTALNATTEANLDPGGAAGDTYAVRYNVRLRIPCTAKLESGSITVAVDTNDGGGWVERAATTYAGEAVPGECSGYYEQWDWTGEVVNLTVSGLGLNDDIRLRIKATSGSIWSFSVHGFVEAADGTAGVTYSTASDATASMTPDTEDAVTWDSLATA